MDSPILTLDEMAAVLKVTPRWLRRSLCPRIRQGRVVRYDRDVVLHWFRSFGDTARAA
jgi:hypothetical protein